MEKEADDHKALNLEQEETLEDRVNASFDSSLNVENEPLIQKDMPIKLTGKLREVWNIW